MTQLSILNGIYASPIGDWRSSYPRNMVPVPKQQGISAGFLRPGDGLTLFATGQGADRGGIAWDGVCYRVSGGSFVRVNSGGTVDVLGSVPGAEVADMDYSFDRLAIVAGGQLWYWGSGSLTQVTDADLGTVHSVVFVDGYFALCDDDSIIVTDLADPTSINPLRYGSSEADPDKIMRVLKVRNELTAVNRYTIESFVNAGGSGFPFRRNAGAMVTRGAIGRRAACVFEDAVAFVGSGRDEPPSVYIASNGQALPIATQEIDMILREYTEAELSAVVVEAQADKQHRRVLVHLPDQTLVYDLTASKALEEPVWFTLDSGLGAPAQYRARGLVWCYDRWLAGDPTGPNIAALTSARSDHFGQVIGWGFGTQVIYNEGRMALVRELELVGLPGRVAFGADPVIWTQHGLDGETWSVERPISVGKQGERDKRMVWRNLGNMNQYRMQRFRGTSDAFVSFARLEAKLEPLNG